MKKKIHDIRIMAALLMAGAAFTACSTDGDDLINEQPQEQTPKTYTITVQATKDLDATRGLVLSGNELNSVWEVGEKVKVVQENASNEPICIGELTATTAGKYATLTGTVNDTFDPTKALTFHLHNTTYDYTGQDGTLATIGKSHTFGYCEKTASEITVSGLEVTITGPISFSNEQAVVRFNLVDEASGNPVNAKSLTIHDGNGNLLQSYDNLDFNVLQGDIVITSTPASNIIYAALSYLYSSTVTLIAFDGTNRWTYTKSNVTFNHGKYYQVQVKMKKVPTPHVGEFLGKDGSFTTTKQTSGDKESVAVIAYVGSVPGYFDEFIALALEDANSSGQNWEYAPRQITNYAVAHPVTLYGVTYNSNSLGGYYCLDFYDVVDNNQTKSSATATTLKKGWRMPTVTDWRYVIYGIASKAGLTLSYDGTKTATSPVGISDGMNFSTSEWGVEVLNAINAACGNTELQSSRYWTGSDYSGDADQTWRFDFHGCRFWYQQTSLYDMVRAVFAY